LPESGYNNRRFDQFLDLSKTDLCVIKFTKAMSINQKLKIVIIGASGTIGKELQKYWRKRTTK